LSGGWLGGLALGWFLLAVGALGGLFWWWCVYVCGWIDGQMDRWMVGWIEASVSGMMG